MRDLLMSGSTTSIPSVKVTWSGTTNTSAAPVTLICDDQSATAISRPVESNAIMAKDKLFINCSNLERGILWLWFGTLWMRVMRLDRLQLVARQGLVDGVRFQQIAFLLAELGQMVIVLM